ncbi:hypothetical protein [Patulibacter defluvii]|uniref:hypothetical protein n=1 Tax=Patulibacter defluvii TaxID=3095358 RepID=UPI002A763BCE|nr:hypothetical protein [Patulibacter sp. DM4]
MTAVSLALPALAGADVKVAGSAGNPFSGYAYVSGPYTVGSVVPGSATAVTVVPDRTAKPTRLRLSLFRENEMTPFVPLRITLHRTGADGLPGELLATENLNTRDVALGAGAITTIPVPDWPRLEAGTSYSIAGLITASDARLGWAFDGTTATVASRGYGRVPLGASEPDWVQATDLHTVWTEVYADPDPPQTTIDQGPDGPTASAVATFAFSSEPGASFECALDRGDFSPCTSPLTLTGLRDGEHRFAVRAIDGSGNVDPTPAERTFVVDTRAPDTTISSEGGPPFAFSADEPGASFACRIDDAEFAPCTSPFDPGAVGPGRHVFAVRAVDPAGNVDPTPAVREFRVAIPTRLAVRRGTLLERLLVASATLTRTDTGAPVAGAQVTFAIGDEQLCVATTDAAGVAACPLDPLTLVALLSGGYEARYEGDDAHLPSRVTVHIDDE